MKDESVANFIIPLVTKQEELKEGIAHKLAELEGFDWEWIVKNEFEYEWREKADELMFYEASQGVVIKGRGVNAGTRMKTVYHVEPLIGDS